MVLSKLKSLEILEVSCRFSTQKVPDLSFLSLYPLTSEGNIQAINESGTSALMIM